MIDETFKVKLEPITPTFVWSGEILVHKADYELIDGKLVIVDMNKAILKVGKLQDAFREEFAREVQGIKLVFPSATAPREVMMINQYLVPASSLKGLIRTAILNNLSKAKQKVYKEVYNKVRSNLNALIDPNSKFKTRPKDVGKPVEGLLKVKVPFGRGIFVYDAMSRLLIGEPKAKDVTLSLSKIKIVETVGNFRAEAYAITFDKGELEYEAKIVKPQNYGVHENLRNMDAVITKDAIIESLKEFSFLVLDKEKQRVKIAKGETEGLLKDYKQFLNSLKPESDCFPLKMGMFTGHHAKTVNVPSDIEQLRKEVLSKVYRNWDSSTVKLVEWNGKAVGVGWVKVCIS